MEKSIEIIEYNLSYVYQTLIDEFVNNNGCCNESTYNIINWNYIIDSNNCKCFKCVVSKFE
jgi:hypothetical protein